jgi:hypothetical protein
MCLGCLQILKFGDRLELTAVPDSAAPPEALRIKITVRSFKQEMN